MRSLWIALTLLIVSETCLCGQVPQTAVFPYLGYNNPEVRTQDIQVPAGQVFELLTWSAGNSSINGPWTLKVDGVETPVALPSGYDNRPLTISPVFTVAGPRTITLTVPGFFSLVCTYVTRLVQTVATANVASQAVVIPENAAAPVDIILESSTDLITWTAAVAGSYAPSTSKRFFRVRAVAH